MTVVRTGGDRALDRAVDDRVVLITGAASGLGAATADVLAAAGFRVVIADLQGAAAEGAAERLVERGDAALALELDVRDADAAEEAVRRVTGELGGLDVLINNAGTDLTLPFEEIPADAFDRVIDVNLRGPAVMLRAALPALRSSARAQVVNIASTAAFRGWPNASAYHASKWGLRGLGQGLFTELRDHGIRVTTVFAGGMQTPFILERFPDTPLDVLQDPRTVAETIRFVLALPPESVVAEITILPVRETSWP
jgi:NAD(P)-dependent dehydrogenase (short-subunit alcohol dehydrogenase family)